MSDIVKENISAVIHGNQNYEELSTGKNEEAPDFSEATLNNP